MMRLSLSQTLPQWQGTEICLVMKPLFEKYFSK